MRAIFYDRRKIIALAASLVLAAAVSVSLFLILKPSGGEAPSGGEGWRMPGGDPAHTSYLKAAPTGILQERWNTRLEGRVAGPPAVLGNRVFACCENGYLYALELESGKPAWRFDAEGEISSMPALGEAGIYLGTADGRVIMVGYDGEPRWELEVGGAVLSTPIPLEDRVYFGSSDRHLYCVAAGDGGKVWSFEAEGPIELSPCIYEGQVFAACFEGNLYALDADDGRLVWTYESMGLPVVHPCADDGKVFLATEFMVSCADVQSGKLLWECPLGSTVISNLAIRGNQLILVLGGPGREAAAFSMDTRTGDFLWQAPCAESPAWTTVTSTNDNVYLARPDFLSAVAVEAGTPALNRELRDVLTWTLATTEELLMAATEADKLYCFAQ